MTATSEGDSAADGHRGDGSADAAEDDDPATADGNADPAPDTDAGEPTRTTTHRPGDDVVHPDTADRNWSWRGDLLLVVLLLSLIVAPVIVFLRPPALEWRVRLLIFPLLPGLLLAVVAVWATTRP